MISEKKRLEIANICYAYIAGEFAYFANPKNRSEAFTWEGWIERCVRSSTSWMFIHDVRGDSEAINEAAQKYAREIATTLVKRYLDN